MRLAPFFSLLLLTACVTINIYFPAAAAEKVADEIIKGIQSEDQSQTVDEDELPAESKGNQQQFVVYQWIENILNIIISPAQAAEADLSVNTAEIRALRATMHSRFPSLKPFYAKGLVGIKLDGFIVSRGTIPLKDKNKLNKLIAAENADRQSLYQAIANANGHPDWVAQIKSTFASRWVSNAQSGWWYQTANGSWKQK